MAGGWFHESWEAERQIQRLNAESSYDGGAALVLPLRRSWVSRQDASSGRVLSQGRQPGTGVSRCLSRESSVASPLGLRCLWLLCIVSRRYLLRQKIFDFYSSECTLCQSWSNHEVR